ncbi:MAG: hypothetical protein WCB18_01860 [Thermoplasmata archaeon]
MSESSSSNYLTNANNAWTEVGNAVNRATELYVTELSAYLNWARDFQRELLEQSAISTQAISRFGEKQLAFFARIRENVPGFGIVPKGTETVAGMVEAIVQETEPKA